jgi:hypothetical protein
MGLLKSDYERFNKDDVEMMKNMMVQFMKFHGGAALPDYSVNYAGYLPVFAIALLSSQESVDRLTKRLTWLTVILVVLTMSLAGLTLMLVLKQY